MIESENYTMAQRMLDAAISAYDISYTNKVHFNPGSKTNKKYWTPIGIIDGTAKAFTDGKDHDDAAFVALTDDNWVVLSFRGTLSTFNDWKEFVAFLNDWLQDDKTKPIHMSVAGQSLGYVQMGFLEALNALWPDVKIALDGIDWGAVKGIQITGHSKGAAMTFLAAAMIKVLYPQAKEINVHAFAAPLAGQPDFAAWYQGRHLGAGTTRYQRMYDIVPFVPPWVSWDIFDHMGFPKSVEGAAIEVVLKGLSLTVFGGYQEVGSLVFLPDPPSTSHPVVGKNAVLAAQNAVVHAIEFGMGRKIADAHSGRNSYWPALFQSE